MLIWAVENSGLWQCSQSFPYYFLHLPLPLPKTLFKIFFPNPPSTDTLYIWAYVQHVYLCFTFINIIRFLPPTASFCSHGGAIWANVLAVNTGCTSLMDSNLGDSWSEGYVSISRRPEHISVLGLCCLGSWLRPSRLSEDPYKNTWSAPYSLLGKLCCCRNECINDLTHGLLHLRKSEITVLLFFVLNVLICDQGVQKPRERSVGNRNVILSYQYTKT